MCSIPFLCCIFVLIVLTTVIFLDAIRTWLSPVFYCIIPAFDCKILINCFIFFLNFFFSHFRNNLVIITRGFLYAGCPSCYTTNTHRRVPKGGSLWSVPKEYKEIFTLKIAMHLYLKGTFFLLMSYDRLISPHSSSVWCAVCWYIML